MKMRRVHTILFFALLLYAFPAIAADDLGLTGAWNLYEKNQTEKARERVVTALSDANAYLLGTEDLKPEDERQVLNAMMNATGLALTNERALKIEGRIIEPQDQRSYVELLSKKMEGYLASARERGALEGMNESEQERFNEKRERLLVNAMELLPEGAARTLFKEYETFLTERGVVLQVVLQTAAQAPAKTVEPVDGESTSIGSIIKLFLVILLVMVGFSIAQKFLHSQG